MHLMINSLFSSLYQTSSVILHKVLFFGCFIIFVCLYFISSRVHL